MKKFSFPFQRAMDWRERRAEQERSELERLHGMRNRIQESRYQLDRDLQDLGRQPDDEQVTTSEALHQLAAFSSSLKALDLRLRAEESRCVTAITQQQNKCTQADRDARLLSHLHDRSRRAWEYENARELEQIAADSWNAGYSRQAGQATKLSE